MILQSPITSITSLFFAINAIHAYLYNYYIYTAFFFGLTLFSLLQHIHNKETWIYNKHKWSLLWFIGLCDRIMLWAVIFYGGYALYANYVPSLLVLCVVVCFFKLRIFVAFYYTIH